MADLALADDQRRDLSRHRWFATALLLVAAGIFIASHVIGASGYWDGMVRAAAEAALIGGIADWFAVTALFRHPLGIPIPHTAVIPNNKERIGQGLARFIESHFLEPELIGARLRGLGLTARLGTWLSRPENAETVASRVVALIPFVLDRLDDRDVQRFLQVVLRQRLKAVDAAPTIGAVLGLLRAGDRHQALFDHAVGFARQALRTHRADIFEVVQDRSRWWVPRQIDRRVAEAIVEGIATFLDDLGERDHPVRRQFDQAVDRLIADLRHSPDYAARVAALRDQIAASEPVKTYLGSLWQELRQSIAAGDARLHGWLRGAIQGLGAALVEDPALCARADRRIEASVISLIGPWRGEIGGFFADVVRGWEARTIADRIELAVGRDLQFIRINGTLVGAFVGMVIYVLAEAAF